MPATLESRLPLIVAELRPRVSAAIKEGAEVISESAKTKVPDAPPIGEGLVSAIHVENTGTAEYSVVAGDTEHFYGHMLEHGTTHSSPRPFLIPAMEENASVVEDLVTAVLQGL